MSMYGSNDRKAVKVLEKIYQDRKEKEMKDELVEIEPGVESGTNRIYRSSKVYDGFSTCFRQWRAKETHCQYLHGYAVKFEVTFEGILDQRNWCYDFGGLKRSSTLIDGLRPNEWVKWLLDHTVIIAENDPSLPAFRELQANGIIQLRILEHVGAERFAEYLFNKFDAFVSADTDGRVRVKSLKFSENDKNSATVER